MEKAAGAQIEPAYGTAAREFPEDRRPEREPNRGTAEGCDMAGIMQAAEEGTHEGAQTKSGVIASIIVPAYNEEEGLQITLDKIYKAVDGVCEVLVVDDGSDDATSKVASRFPCKVLKHAKNLGKGAALKTGIRHASGKYLIFIDADDTYPPEAIPLMYEALESCDVVYASRTGGRDNIPRLNRLGGLIFQGLLRHLYGFKASDYSTGLYGIRKHHLEQMEISSSGFSVEPEIAIKASRMKLRMRDIPIRYGSRVGQAKLHWLDAGFGHLKTILSLVLWRPSDTRP
ncbi:MAG: glycosyltransferase family 2 protein [Dehalococcoidia bacterium]